MSLLRVDTVYCILLSVNFFFIFSSGSKFFLEIKRFDIRSHGVSQSDEKILSRPCDLSHFESIAFLGYTVFNQLQIFSKRFDVKFL